MKRNTLILLLILSIFVFYSANGQSSFDVIDENDNSIAGTNFNLQTEPDVTIIYDFRIVNLTESAINTRIEKKEISLIDGSVNFFCIPSGSCIPPANMMSPAFEVAAGETTNICQVDYIPGTNTGTSIIEYTVFNDDNPDDKVSFTVNFVVGASNIPENKTGSLSVYPNPATNVFYIENNTKTNATVEVYNMLGSVKAKYETALNGKTITVDCSRWENGIYFIRLVENGKATRTIRQIVKK
jgi:hypothetical protein